MIALGLGVSLLTFSAGAVVVATTQRRAALTATAQVIEPEQVAELPVPAYRARQLIVSRWTVSGLRDYTLASVRVGLVLGGLTVALAAALTLFERSWGLGPGGDTLLAGILFTLGLSCLIALAG